MSTDQTTTRMVRVTLRDGRQALGLEGQRLMGMFGDEEITVDDVAKIEYREVALGPWMDAE